MKGFIGNKTGIIIFIIVLILIFFWRPIVHSSVTKVCGRYIGEGEMRGVKDFKFEYVTSSNKVHRISQSQSFFKLNADELQAIDCIEMEYSNILNFSAEVTDKRVLKK